MINSDSDDQEHYDCPSCDRKFTSYRGMSVHHTCTHGEKLKHTVEIECDQCGSVFTVRPSRDHRRFCSRECSQQWHRGDNHPNSKQWIETTCENCGSEFEMMPYKFDNAQRHFCDENCRAEWVGEWATGRYTGEDHWMHNIDPEDHPMWNGGPFPYGPGWNTKKKRAVRERDGYECVSCGMTQAEHYKEYDMNLHVHHIKQARNFDNPERRNAMDNLVTLCLACHRRYEGVPIEVQT